MRFYQLKESDIKTKINKDLSDIARQGKLAQQKNPKIASQIASVLKQVKDLVSKTVAKGPTQPVKVIQPKMPVPEESVGGIQPVPNIGLVANTIELQKMLNDPKIAAMLPPSILQKVDSVVGQAKEMTLDLNTEKKRASDAEKRAEDAGQEALQKVRDLRSKVKTLAIKVVNYTEIGDSERAKMNKKDQQSAANADSALESMTDGLNALFQNFVFAEGAPLGVEEVDKFIDGCIDGKVVNMPAVINSKTGFIDRFVNGEYKKVYDVIAKDLVNFKGMGTTGGALGPAEILLSAVGSPVSTGTGGVKGDLAVDMGGEIGMLGVEVKAGSGAKKSGARLNGTKISDGKGALDKMKTLYKVLDIKEEELPGKSSYSITGPYIAKLNDTVFKRFDDEKLKKWTTGVLNALVLNFDDVVNYKDEKRNVKSTIGKMINATVKGGQINFENLRKLITYTQLISYMLTDEVETILTIDTDNRSFTVTGSPEEFIKNIGVRHIPVKDISITSDPQTASFHWRSA